MRRNDPLILGAGPAGCAAAIMLAKGGAAPVIFERSVETGDALCGGFLSWQTLETLKRLGLADPGGHVVTRLALYAGDRSATATLPHAAIGISRHRLDTRLQQLASDAGAGMERGMTARELGADGAVRFADGQTIRPASLFLATGKHDLRGVARPRSDEADLTLGLRVRLAPDAALTRLSGGQIELHLFDRGYCGFVLQEDGGGNLCMAVRKARLAEAGGDPETLLRLLGDENPALGGRLAFARGGPVEAISAVPYGWRTSETREGLFRLGDQAAVIPSLAGEGNGIALASGIMAATAWTRAGPGGAPAFQQSLYAATRKPVGLAMALWRLSEQPVLAGMATRAVALLPFLAARLAGQTRIRV
jgi:menaquinone-9 beta-reductase